MTIKAFFKQELKHLLWAVLLVAAFSASTMAQTPSTFTYQGRLTDGAVPAGGPYDLEFRLYDSAGAQVGTSLTREDVQVVNGVFTVTLDFGAEAFNGAARQLEIGVRPGVSADAFTTLAPRQPVTSSPYALRSLNAGTAATATTAETATAATNAAQLGGVDAGRYVKTDDPRLVDGPPSPGSPNYIQNQTGSAQAGGFNINGSGMVGGTLTGNVVNAATQFNIGNNRVFSVGGGSSGGAHTNVFVGVRAGERNTTGCCNAFFGSESGEHNTAGEANSFFGQLSGLSNTSGSANSFYGEGAGYFNTMGSNNSFFGASAGTGPQNGSKNTAIGSGANIEVVCCPDVPVINATAIGALAIVGQSNSLVLGSIKGVNFATADTNVGIGTTTPSERLTVKTGTDSYGIVHTDGTIIVGSFVGGAGDGGYLGTKSDHPLHLFANNGPASLTVDTTGRVRIVNLGSAGSTELCRNASNQISNCSSSLRYKTDLHAFTSGLDIVRRLRPISFRWKETGALDVGFGAEDVAAIEPLLVTSNDAGAVEGVKYDRMSVALVNAVREQQTQIERLQMQLTNLQKIVCVNNATAHVCK